MVREIERCYCEIISIVKKLFRTRDIDRFNDAKPQ